MSDNKDSRQMKSLKRRLPAQDLMGNFSDKASFYNYMGE